MSIGHIRVVNIRGGIEAEDGETVIRGDRANPILGNPFHMTMKTMDERMRVIGLNTERVKADMARGGPISELIHDLAGRVNEGENIALECWCAPLPCHLDPVAGLVLEVARKLREKQGEMGTFPRHKP